MEDCTPLRNYHPETPVDDMKKDPSFDVEKEKRRTRVPPKRSLDQTVNTSKADDTVSSGSNPGGNFIILADVTNYSYLGCQKGFNGLIDIK